MLYLALWNENSKFGQYEGTTFIGGDTLGNMNMASFIVEQSYFQIIWTQAEFEV